MATVSDRIYSELPDQPELITTAFNLNKAVPNAFCTHYLEQNVTEKSVIRKGEHDLKFSHFIIDGGKRDKNLPKFNRKHKKLTSRQMRKLRIHDVPKTGQKYDNYLQLHHLWLSYMKEVLRFDRSTFSTTNKGTREILLRADYHGCLITVLQSKCPTYVGKSGIVIQDTREVFKIIDTANMVKVIPKKSCIFTFKLGSYEVKIYGQNFNYRPMDRVSKKFKVKCATLDL
ncbi:ribonuclease P protein subunit p29-like [Watersipora subatra]|uniref:ribonuclease P protein subunit p29-like n=1 Tax=Watersipora subatra TaxID=2589382 RepID=UPI00355C03FC